MKSIYVMITNWNNHWDKISTTYYTKPLIYFPESEICDGMPTIFVKLYENNNVEHIYEGTISDIKEENDKIRFKVHLNRRILKFDFEGSKIPKKPGWYKSETEIQVLDNYLSPPFFKELETTQDWKRFEDLVYYLLKLLGINTIYRYPPEKQPGLPDGVFKIGKLFVIYDCTLKTDYKKEKEMQIDNYINQIQRSPLKLPNDTELKTQDCAKQIWIVTKHQKEVIKKSEEIHVKAVSIDRLIEIYEERLKSIESDADCEKLLENI